MKQKHLLSHPHQYGSSFSRENYYKHQCRATPPRNHQDNTSSNIFDKKSPSIWPIYGLVSTLAVTCYLNGIEGDFVHDDIPAVILNKDVLGQNPVAEVFKNDFWGTPMADEDSHKSYRPLTVLTFRANYVIFGRSPVAFHLSNICLHVVACVLFTKVCLTIAGLKPQFATLAGLLFSCHPIHTEAVTGIVGRADVLACVSFLLSLLAYHGHSLDGEPRVWLSVLMGGISMLAKETGITVFLINLGYDLYLQWTSIKRAISDVRWNSESREFSKRAAKLLTWTGILLAVRLAILQGSLPRFSEQDNPAAFHSSIYVRFLTFCYLAAFNWWLVLCPSTLSHDWQMGSVPLVTSLYDSRNLTTCLFAGLLVLLVRKCLNDFEIFRHPPLILGVLLLVLPYLPASNLLLTVGFVVAERVLYMPSLGSVLLVVYGIQTIWQNYAKHRQTMVCFITLLLVSSCLRTVVRNKDWKSRESLIRAGLQTLPHNAKMHYNYANFLRDSSRYELSRSHYFIALKLWPTYASAHNNLGTILKNKYEAERHFLEAIKYSPNHVNAHYNLGQLYRKNNKTAKSEQMLESCIRLEPNFIPAYIELAKLRGPNHKSIAGIVRKIVNINPTDTYYSVKFADWCLSKRNYHEALKYYGMSVKSSLVQRVSMLGVFKILRKFGQKARLFQLLTRWHFLLRKKGNNLRSDFYLQERQRRIELEFKMKAYSTSLLVKNVTKQENGKSGKWQDLKNKTSHSKNYKKTSENNEDSTKKSSTVDDHDSKILDLSKLAILTYC